jgi:hypothetical protein
MRRLGLGLAIFVLAAFVVPASAATTTDHERSILGLVNSARADRGLQPLRVDNRLWDLAGDRASVMAAKNVMSHTVAGSLRTSLNARRIQWYGFGEAIAWTSTSGSAAAAKALFALWKGSAPHWSILMSSHYNYIGVGLAYRSSNHRTFGAIVVTESKDRSGARAQMIHSDVAGVGVHWSWRGWDLALQTHTAGLRTYTIQQRTDSGPWVTVVRATSATSRSALNKPHGHWYGVRVRATDRAGNIGPWSAESRIWVP